MTFSTSEQVFFNDLHPNEPVQCSHPQQRESNVKTFSSSASKPRGRTTVAEQRLADQVPERKQLRLVQKTAKRVFHAAIKVWGHFRSYPSLYLLKVRSSLRWYRACGLRTSFEAAFAQERISGWARPETTEETNRAQIKVMACRKTSKRKRALTKGTCVKHCEIDVRDSRDCITWLKASSTHASRQSGVCWPLCWVLTQA